MKEKIVAKHMKRIFLFYAVAILVLNVFIFVSLAFCMNLAPSIPMLGLQVQAKGLSNINSNSFLQPLEQSDALFSIGHNMAPIQVDPIDFDKTQIQIDRQLRSTS